MRRVITLWRTLHRGSGEVPRHPSDDDEVAAYSSAVHRTGPCLLASAVRDPARHERRCRVLQQWRVFVRGHHYLWRPTPGLGGSLRLDNQRLCGRRSLTGDIHGRRIFLVTSPSGSESESVRDRRARCRAAVGGTVFWRVAGGGWRVAGGGRAGQWPSRRSSARPGLCRLIFKPLSKRWSEDDRPFARCSCCAIVGSVVVLLLTYSSLGVWAANHFGGNTAVKRRYPPMAGLNTAVSTIDESVEFGHQSQGALIAADLASMPPPPENRCYTAQ